MKLDLSTPEGRAARIQELTKANAGRYSYSEKAELLAKNADPNHFSVQEALSKDLPGVVLELDALRNPTRQGSKPYDLSLGEYAKEKWGFALDDDGTPTALFQAMGLNFSRTTIGELMAMPEATGYRWLVPEIFRAAIQLGLRRNPIYPGLIAGDTMVAQPQVTMPYIKMASAMPAKLGETETVPVGTISFASKNVNLQQVGTGIQVTDEVLSYVTLDIVGTYLQDMGVKLNQALDVMAITTLINGDQTDGSDACAVVGVLTPTTLAYRDLLKAWIKMGLLGRNPTSLLANADMAEEVLMLNEFRNREYMLAPQGVTLRTPVPTNTNVDITGVMPVSNQIMLVDPTRALIKLTSKALNVETERIVRNGINGAYARLTTGFATMFKDARVILDKSLNISAAPYPTEMDATTEMAKGFNS